MIYKKLSEKKESFLRIGLLSMNNIKISKALIFYRSILDFYMQCGKIKYQNRKGVFNASCY